MSLLDLWKKFRDHYEAQGFIFGYSNKELFYRLSVYDKRSGHAKFANMGLTEPIDEYKKTWYRLVKEFTDADKVSQGQQGQV